MNDLQISGSAGTFVFSLFYEGLLLLSCSQCNTKHLFLVVSSPLAFGNSWKVATPPCSDVTTEIFPCERHSYCSAWAQRRCMIIKGDTFSDCHLKVWLFTHVAWHQHQGLWTLINISVNVPVLDILANEIWKINTLKRKSAQITHNFLIVHVAFKIIIHSLYEISNSLVEDDSDYAHVNFFLWNSIKGKVSSALYLIFENVHDISNGFLFGMTNTMSMSNFITFNYRFWEIQGRSSQMTS